MEGQHGFDGACGRPEEGPCPTPHPRNRRPLRRDRARPRHPRISAQARPCAGRAGGRARRRASSIRSSSAASTGTAASTASGCCCGSGGCFPDLPVAPRIEALADEMLAPDKVAGELAYLDRAYSGGFERPYGWAWLLALHAEAQRHEDRPWADDLEPLAARLRRALPDLSAQAHLSDPRRHPFQHRLRDDPRARMGRGERRRARRR